MKSVNSLGTRCPRPIIDIAQALKDLQIGDEITLLADDPATWPDLQAWARMTKNIAIKVKACEFLITKRS